MKLWILARWTTWRMLRRSRRAWKRYARATMLGADRPQARMLGDRRFEWREKS